MTFASVRQIVVLTVLTAGLLFGIDRLKNPHRVVIRDEGIASTAAADAPTIRLWLNHVSCAGCLTRLQKALSDVPWLETPKVTEKPPLSDQGQQTPGAVTGYRQQLLFEIAVPQKDLASVDFVIVQAAVRKAGFTAAQMEFSGLPHYRLEADLAPMCSPACVAGTREALDDLVRASRPKGWFRWLDSYRVDGVNDSLVIYPRMGATVDVMELMGAINAIGFETGALTVHTQGAK